MPRQRCEQYLTSSQHDAHFLRQLNGRWQLAQSFFGKNGFLCMQKDIGALSSILKSVPNAAGLGPVHVSRRKAKSAGQRLSQHFMRSFPIGRKLLNEG